MEFSMSATKSKLVQLIGHGCIVASLTLLSACEGKFSNLSNQDLAEKAERCKNNDKPSPGAAVACGNILKECSRRRKEGNYAC